MGGVSRETPAEMGKSSHSGFRPSHPPPKKTTIDGKAENLDEVSESICLYMSILVLHFLESCWGLKLIDHPRRTYPKPASSSRFST